MNIKIRSIKVRSRVNDRTLAVISNQFATMLRAGLTLFDTVRTLAKESTSGRMREILSVAGDDLEAGMALSESLQRQEAGIPGVFVETVSVGESSGKLASCFKLLETYFKRADQLKQKVRSVLAYPAALVVVAVVVTGAIFVMLVPRIQSSAGGAGELPALVRAVMKLYGFFASSWDWLLFLTLILLFYISPYLKTPEAVLRIWQIKVRVPVVGRILSLTSVCQLASTMSLLLSAGIRAIDAVAIAGRGADPAMKLALDDMGRRLEAGERFSDVVSSNPVFPPVFAAFVRAGENSGALASELDAASSYYEEEVSAATEKAAKILGPAVLALVGVLVGAVVLTVYSMMMKANVSVGLAG